MTAIYGILTAGTPGGRIAPIIVTIVTPTGPGTGMMTGPPIVPDLRKIRRPTEGPVPSGL